MKRLSDERRGSFSDSSKRSKVVPKNPPRQVVFIGGLPNDAIESDIIQLGLPFGRMTNLVFAKKKCQALLEMADLESAEAMVEYYVERPPRLGSHTMIVRFSNYEKLKTEPTAQNAGAMAALKAADEVMDNADKPQSILRIVVDNMIYPITIDVIHKIFSKFGQVLRIVTYMKNNLLHAFVEYANAVVAAAAKNSLHGQNIYNGGCMLRVDFSNMGRLSVKYNNDKMWDYTNPDLPRGDERMRESDFHAVNDVAVRTGMNMSPTDMHDMRMPGRNMPSAGRHMRLDDDFDDQDIDDEFAGGGYSGNVRNLRDFDDVGPRDVGMGRSRQMEGMDESDMRGMMMNSMGGMMGPGMMGGFGGMGGAGVGPMGLMGTLDGLSRLASNLGQMNAMRGGMVGSEDIPRRMGDGMRGGMPGSDERPRRMGDGMDRGRGAYRGRGGRMERSDRHDMGPSRHHELDTDGRVVLVSNMNQEKITTDKICTLFGVYGSVLRVKILYNKKDSALVEYDDPEQAQNACEYLHRARWWGKLIQVRPSTAKRVQLAKPGVEEPWLTKEFTDSNLSRFRNPHSKNFHNIFPPSATLHLSNIPADITEDDITELFSEHGHVQGFKFFLKDRRMALIEMSSVEEAIEALVELHNHEFGPRNQLHVSFTQSTIRR